MRKTKQKKPKVYIPPYKVLILCLVIIAICMVMLLATTIKSPDSPKNQQTSITQRYTQQEEQKEKNIKAEPQSHSTKTETQKTKPAASKNNQPNQKKVTPSEISDKSAVSVKQSTSQTNKPAPQQKQTSTQNQQNTQQTTSSKNTPQAPKYDFPVAKNGAQLVFVFDDAGNNVNQAKEFLKVNIPYTVAVLPKLANSRAVADLFRNAGKEVILHQPMQTISNMNPGPGLITKDMDENQIISLLFSNLDEIGPCAGLNNHEGSLITADAEIMAVVLKFCSEQELYFLDSRTNKDTKVPFVAQEMGYSYYDRQVFLDNSKTRENFITELRRGLDIANKTGVAIMIGHIQSANVIPATLNEIIPELKAKGYTFKTVSECNGKKGY